MKKNWQGPSCDICGDKKHIKAWLTGVTTWEYKGKFNYVRCGNCGLVFQSPRPPAGAAIEYYPSDVYWGRDVRRKKKTPGMEEEREKSYGNIYSEIFKRIKKGRVLDIGSGLGLFLSKFKEKGWVVLGTDISLDVAKYAKDVFGIKTEVGDLGELNLPKNYFNVITLISVLEHVYSPRYTLRKLRAFMKNDALLVLLIPNADGLGRHLFKKEWIQLSPARHLYLFNPASIKRLLVDEGFEILKISHKNWEHNFYSLFQSFRLKFSPKFAKSNAGGLLIGSVEDVRKKSSFSLIKEFAKIFAFIFASLIAVLEQISNTGDTIAIYAQRAEEEKH